MADYPGGLVGRTARRLMASPRYAIYYTPPRDAPLTELASRWLARDAFKCERRAPILLDGFDPDEIERMTTGPRHYGFHATMKAPFELADGKTESELLDTLDQFAEARNPFEVQISPQSLGEFIALRLDRPSEDMTALHSDCVTEFDDFRAPLSEEDIARRRRARLTPEQDARMLDWGYPYIFDEFRWHMTLTNRIKSDVTRTRAIDGLQGLFRDVCTSPHLVDGIAVYFQTDRDAPFHVLKRAAFGGQLAS